MVYGEFEIAVRLIACFVDRKQSVCIPGASTSFLQPVRKAEKLNE
jgi:hypothetical protein